MAYEPWPLPEDFFTADRLQYYRELHDRYPLWCGHWLPDLNQLPSANAWSVDARINAAIEEDAALEGEELPENFVTASIDPPKPDSVSWPRVYAYIRRGSPEASGIHSFRGCNPPILAVYLAAINYTLQRWTEIEDPPEYEKKPSTKEALVENLGEILLDNSKHLDLTNDFWGTALRLRRTSSSPSPQEDREELEENWIKIGRRAQILPARQGGLQCKLPDEFLAELHKEAERIIEELIEAEPSENLRESIRPLIPVLEGADVPDQLTFSALTEEEKDRIQFLRERGWEEMADERESKALREADKKLRTDSWCRRLLFPMLSPQEIERLRTRVRLEGRTVQAAAWDLLANRLPISRKTILNRTRSCRA